MSKESSVSLGREVLSASRRLVRLMFIAGFHTPFVCMEGRRFCVTCFVAPGIATSGSTFPLQRTRKGILKHIHSLIGKSAPQTKIGSCHFFISPLSSLPPRVKRNPQFNFAKFVDHDNCNFGTFTNRRRTLTELRRSLNNSFIAFAPTLEGGGFFILSSLGGRKHAPFVRRSRSCHPIPTFKQRKRPTVRKSVGGFYHRLLRKGPMPNLSGGC